MRDAVTNAVLTVFLLPAAASLLLLWRWERLARRKLADRELRGYVLVTWTGRRSFWRRPEIAALLLPVRGPEASGAGRPTAPAELARAIEQACQALPAPARSTGEPASAAGRSLLASIQQLDRELADLAETVDAAEIARLADKLSALGPPSPSEGEDRQQMREMFQKQLGFMHGLEARLEESKLRRARRLELLRTLWVVVAELRAAVGAEAMARASGRLRDLFRGIEQQAGDLAARTQPRANQASIADKPTLER